MKNRILTAFLLICISTSGKAQEGELPPVDQGKFSPFELLSSYYNQDFKPFKKGNIYWGLAFSLEDRKSENRDNLFEKVIDGNRLNYDILLKGGYYLFDYGMAGLNINYYQNKFEGTLFRDPDTVQSSSITRGFEINPNFRSTIPLTPNERLSFFTAVGLTIGGSNTLKRDVKYEDEIEKSFATNYNLRLGLSPGVTFFAMENFALEFQLNVLGYELNVEQKSTNGMDESQQIRQNVDFKLNILSLKLGLAYYFPLSKK